MTENFEKLEELMRYCPVCAALLVISTLRVTKTDKTSERTVEIVKEKCCPEGHVTLNIVPDPVYAHEEPAAVFSPEDFIFQEN